MYEKINNVSELVEEAKMFVLYNDRREYIPIMKELENYCIRNGVVVGGNVGINMIVKNEPDKDDFYYDIYIGDTFKHAKALADSLCAVTDKLIFVDTNVKDRIFTIYINARPMVKLIHMSKYKNVDLIDLINPITISARFTEGKIKCMSVEMQLIDIYQKLYRPYPAGIDYPKYGELLDKEERLFKIIKHSIKERATTGSGQQPPKRKNTITVSSIQKSIINDIVKENPNCVLCGDYAISESGDSKRLQIISDSAKDFAETVKNSIIDKNVPSCFITFDMNLPTDMHILKYIVYATIGGDQVVVVEIFNSAEYELIPFRIEGGIKIALESVIIRFKLIDIYSTRIVMGLGTVNKKYLMYKIEQMVDQVIDLRKKYMDLPLPERFIDNESKFVGVYISDNVLKKKISIGFFPRYFPCKKKLNFNI